MSWVANTKRFLGEVRTEIGKVSFPSRAEVLATTAVVLVTSAIFAVYLYLSDQVVVRLYRGILAVFGT